MQLAVYMHDYFVKAHLLLQSMSIFEYLVELYPDSSLLPEDPIARARIRSIAQYIVSEIQPLQNTRIDGLLAEMVMHHTEFPLTRNYLS